MFAGKVGTGFDDRLLKELNARFEKLEVKVCPFANVPEKRSSRYGQNLTPGEMKKCRWLRPRLVCQVKFAEWTRDGKLRQPVFLGLREDKSAAEVIRERPSNS
jgi:bifunctional non-homologous end joining protein LigD